MTSRAEISVTVFVDEEKMGEPLSDTYSPSFVKELLDASMSRNTRDLTVQWEPSDSIPTLSSTLDNINLTCWQDGRFVECWHTETYSGDSAVPLGLVGSNRYHVLFSPKGLVADGSALEPYNINGVRYRPMEFSPEIIELFAEAGIPIPYVPIVPPGPDGCSKIGAECIPPLILSYLLERIPQLAAFIQPSDSN